MFEILFELTPKDDAVAESGEVKTPADTANDMIRYLLEDIGLKN
jgi:hypothetical protein